MERSISNRTISNIIWNIGGNILAWITSFVGTSFVSKRIGASWQGILAYDQAVLAILVSFSTLGMSGIIINELVMKKETDEVMGTYLYVKIWSSVVFFAVGYLWLCFGGNREEKEIYLILSPMLLFSGLDIYSYFFQADLSSQIYIKYVSGIRVFLAFLKILLSYAKVDIYFLFILVSIENLSPLIIGFWVYKRKYGVKIKRNKVYEGELSKKSRILIIAEMAVVLYNRADQVMVKMLSGNREGGIYSVAVIFAEAWFFIPCAIGNNMYGYISKIDGQPESTKERFWIGYFAVMNGISLIFIVIIVLFSKPCVWLFFGEEYMEAVKPMKLYALSGMFNALNMARVNFLISNKRYRFESFSISLGAVLNIFLNFLFIPYFGIQGAAWATVIASMVNVVLSNFLSKEMIGLGVMIIKSFCPKTIISESIRVIRENGFLSFIFGN